MSEDILEMMAKAKAAKKKATKKKVAKKVEKKVEQEVIRIPDKPKAKEIDEQLERVETIVEVKKDPYYEVVNSALKEYGRESDIPVNHAYWRCLNKIRENLRNDGE